MSIGFIFHFIDDVGRRFWGAFHYSGQILLMTYLSLRAGFVNEARSFRAIATVIFSQVYFTGVQALPLISVLAIGSSSVVAMQSSSQFNILGGSNLIGQLLVAVVIREIAPLLTALIVIARSGTAVASEIGSMRVNREIEALEVMGINPLSYIIFPRLMGGIISVICLSLYFVYMAILGGFVFAKLFMNMPLSFYIDSIMQVFAIEDVYMFSLKIFFSGCIIFTIACYQGLQVQQGPHEVPQATTKAVVNSIIYVIGFNLTATLLFYLNQLIKLGVL